MNIITELALGLAARFPKALGPESEPFKQYVKNYRAEGVADCRSVLSLFEQRAGLVPRPKSASVEVRLNNPRLKAVYPAERKRALAAAALRYADTIASLIGPLSEAVAKYEFAQAEYHFERDREKAGDQAAIIRKESGLFAEVAVKADALHDVFGVTYWHWACLRPEEVRAIAAILLRRPVDELPPVDANPEQEG